MSNHLAMDKAQSIQHLHDLGWSQRKIAATLSVDRKSVKRYLKDDRMQLSRQQALNQAVITRMEIQPHFGLDRIGDGLY